MVDPAPTREEARIALKQYAKDFGDEAALRLLHCMANVASVKDIPDSKLLEVLNAAYEPRMFPKPKSWATSKGFKKMQEATKKARGHINVNNGLKRGA